jgi:hypothetical protein
VPGLAHVVRILCKTACAPVRQAALYPQLPPASVMQLNPTVMFSTHAHHNTFEVVVVCTSTGVMHAGSIQHCVLGCCQSIKSAAVCCCVLLLTQAEGRCCFAHGFESHVSMHAHALMSSWHLSYTDTESLCWCDGVVIACASPCQCYAVTTVITL